MSTPPNSAPEAGPRVPLDTATAPPAPGRLGEPVDPTEAGAYLTALGEWVAGRRAELHSLDAAALAAAEAEQLTADIRLSLALWQAVKNRYDLLLTTWDSGRVGVQERQRLSTLIWGRLDTTVDAPGSAAALQGMLVSLPEACRLSDALAGQLRTRLQLDPQGSQVSARIRDLRAQMERLRDQVALEKAQRADLPGGRDDQRVDGHLAQLASRVETIADKASRGGDVGGLLGPVEIEASTFERDLIVGGAQRRRNRATIERANALRAELEAREPSLRALVQQAVDTVSPAPKYAVPDASALGIPPAAAADLNAYVQRLEQVRRAMQLVESAYSTAIGEHARLVSAVAALRAKVQADDTGDTALTALLASADAVLSQRPCPMAAAGPLVTACEQYATWKDQRAPQAAGESTP